MAVNLSPIGGVAGQFFDNNGNPLVGGKLFTYAAGTTTPQTTFTTSTGSTPNSNPIILNGGGRVPSEIWLTDGFAYKFVLYSSTDQLIGSWDNISGINSNFVNYTASQEIQTATSGQTVFTLTTMQYQPGTNSLTVYVDGVNQYGPGALFAYVETSSTVVTFTNGLHVGAEVKFTSVQQATSSATDAAQISYQPAGAGAVTTNVQTKLRETVSVKDFGAVGDGVTDDTAAIQAAINSSAKVIYFPNATYLCEKLSVTSKDDVLLSGNNSTLLMSAAAFPGVVDQNIDVITSNRVTIENFIFDAQNSITPGLNRGGVAIDASNDCTVDSCYFYDVRTGVSVVNASNRVKITNNIAKQQLPYSLSNETNLLLMDLFAAVTSAASNVIVSQNQADKVRVVYSEADFTTVTSNIVSNTYDTAIYLLGVEGGVIEGNTVNQSGKDAIKCLNGCRGVVIANNFVFGFGNYVTNSPDGILITDSTDISITGNTVRLGDSTGRVAPDQNGITVTGGSNIAITGNEIFTTDPGGNVEFGIRIAPTTSEISKVTITGNIVNNVKTYCLLLGFSNNYQVNKIRISGNIFNGSVNTLHTAPIGLLGTATQTITGVEIFENTLRSFSVAAINIAAPVASITIKNNRIEDARPGNGWCLQIAGTGTMTNVIIDQNDTDGTEAGYYNVATAALRPQFVRGAQNKSNGVLRNPNLSVDGTNVATPYSALQNQSGMLFDNTGATGSVTITLPAAIPGLNYTFSRLVAQNIVINTTSSQTIENTKNGTGTYATNQTMTTADAVVQLQCIKSGRWQVVMGGY